MRILQADNLGKTQILSTFPEAWMADSQPETGLIWVDLNYSEDIGSIETLLREQFGFHPLAIDDALHETHIPKLDDWESYLYMVLQDVVCTTESSEIDLPELDIFLGKRFLVTYHQRR